MTQPVLETVRAPGPLYREVADRIARLIEGGAFRVGGRVPSVRALRRSQRVSLATALQAYRVLEDRGLIEARPQSGFYVRLPPGRLPLEPEESQPPVRARPVALGDLVARFQQAARDPACVGLGTALVHPGLLPIRALHRTLAAVGRHSPQLANSYDVAPGSLALRVQIARRAFASGCTLAPEDLIVTNGCQEALQLCLRAVARAGDTIGIESPTYFGLLQSLETLGLRACQLPTRAREGLCLEGLEARLDRCRIKAVLLMPNFGNPLGACLPDAKKQKLVRLLAARGVPLIEDDIYGELAFAPARPYTAKAYDRDGLVLLCSSFSKTLAPGYRIGWVAPGRYRHQVTRLKYLSSIGTASVLQLAVADFLAHGGFDHHLRRLRRACAEQVARTTDAVACHFPAGTKVTRPAGGYILWVQLPPHVDAVALFERAWAERISIAPGPLFAADGGFRNYLRLNCGLPWSDQVERAIARLGQLTAKRL
jgi:DNA-binding transcriptional MocR family regulator